jgi:hypothetical protein
MNINPDFIGYAASVLVAVSLLFSSMLRLRLLNLAGSAVFIVYGLLIEAYPVALTNTFIFGVNVWHIIRLMKNKKKEDSV